MDDHDDYVIMTKRGLTDKLALVQHGSSLCAEVVSA